MVMGTTSFEPYHQSVDAAPRASRIATARDLYSFT
jgi:hypothetical protein